MNWRNEPERSLSTQPNGYCVAKPSVDTDTHHLLAIEKVCMMLLGVMWDVLCWIRQDAALLLVRSALSMAKHDRARSLIESKILMLRV